MSENNESGRYQTKRIFLDSEACGGCLTCVQICSARHFHECRPNLSAIRIHVDFYNDTFTLFNCHQCPKPRCKEACPVEAIQYDEERGSFYVDDDLCIRCGSCVEACPFKNKMIPCIEMSPYDGEDFIVKCDLCHGYEDGPACVVHCPRGALSIR